MKRNKFEQIIAKSKGHNYCKNCDLSFFPYGFSVEKHKDKLFGFIAKFCPICGKNL